MTTPSGIDPELVGTTKPEILQLALSGHLAAASGGENHISQEEGIAAVSAVAPSVGWAAEEPAAETPAETPAPAATTTQPVSKDAKTV